MKRKFTNQCLFLIVLILGFGSMSAQAVTSIVISVANGGTASVQNGGQIQLTATVYPTTASQSVTWDSFNEITGTVDSNGLVTANVVGTATIRATAGGVTASFPVEVTQPNPNYTEVGLGTSALLNQSPVPVATNAKYSYTQTIYNGGDLTAIYPQGGKISKLRWYFKGITQLPNEQNIAIYLGNTSKSKYVGNGNPAYGSDPASTDWVPASQLTKVYQGPMPIDSKGWIEITFDIPFDYDGTSNIVLATNETFNDNDQFDSTQDKFYAIHPFIYRSIYQGSMNTALNPNAPIEGALSYYIPDISFIFKNVNNLGTNEVISSDNGLIVYPNPAKTTVNIKANKKIKQVSIYNTTGQLVSQQKSDIVNVNSLVSGIYLLKVVFEDNTSAIKKIIKK